MENKMEKVIKADLGTRDDDEAQTPPIATNRCESGKKPDREESYQGSQLKKSKVTKSNRNSNNGHNNSGTGGSQPRQNKDDSPNMDTSTEQTNCTVQMTNNNNEFITHQYVAKLLARKKDNENNIKKPPNERLDAVVNALRERALDKNLKRKQDNQETTRNTERHRTNENQPPIRKTKLNENVMEILSVKVKHIGSLYKTFKYWFKKYNKNKKVKFQKERLLKRKLCDLTKKIINERSAEEITSSDDSMDRSEDNILISNKYKTFGHFSNNNQYKCQDESVPIGSGSTLIQKDKYDKVNWKSYTIATRTLLLAAFSRSILATHSLTGKRSPAFQDKPAKMCLDPTIVADILMEITSRFEVKANLVRSIITTKCADEAKMLRMRTSKKNAAKRARQPSIDQENITLFAKACSLKDNDNELG